MEREDERKGGSAVLLTVIGIATLLVAIVGATFAYFTATVSGDTGSSITIQTATLSISYNDGNALQVTGVQPGWTADKTITITNGTAYAAGYTLQWATGLVNQFGADTVHADEWKYKVDCAQTVGVTTVETLASTTLPGNGTASTGAIEILADKVIPANTTLECKLTFSFAELSTEQDYYQGKYFYGVLELIAAPIS